MGGEEGSLLLLTRPSRALRERKILLSVSLFVVTQAAQSNRLLPLLVSWISPELVQNNLIYGVICNIRLRCAMRDIFMKERK